MRRRTGQLLPLEVRILRATAGAAAGGNRWVHGFALAKDLRSADGARTLTAHGTLYKALGRLADAGLLEDRWEEPETALAEGRPRRRLYRVTALGQQALASAEVSPDAAPRRTPRIAPA